MSLKYAWKDSPPCPADIAVFRHASLPVDRCPRGERNMGTKLRIPDELQRFLDLPGPQSLLIRGPPGTGKSTLSLALLEAFSGQRTLVTNRVGRVDLLRSFPWLGEGGTASIEIVDGTKDRRSVEESSKALNNLHRLVHAPQEISRDLQEFLWLPPALQDAWSRLDGTERSLVVVDSWDALVEEYVGLGPGASPPPAGMPTRADIERLLLRRMSSIPNHLVLVLERPHETQLDYLVNGTVVTDRSIRSERVERWLTLPKLRGTRIANVTYPFTLEGGRFQCIDPIQPYGDISVGRFTPEPDRMRGYLWPGSESFAENFGRLALGRITLIERDEGVLQHIPRILVSPMIAHTLHQGSRVVLVPELGGSPKDVWTEMRGALDRNRFLENLRIVEVETPGPYGATPDPEDLSKILLPLEATGGSRPDAQPFDTSALRFLLEGATVDRPALLVVHLGGLEARFSSRPSAHEPWQERYVALLRRITLDRPVHMVVIGSSNSPLTRFVQDACRIHLHLETRQGRVFAHASTPWTPSFVLTEPSENRPYDLLRVV